MSATFEARLVAGCSLALVFLGVVALVTFPVLAGFNPRSVAANAAMVAGFAASYAFARRGRVQAATTTLFWFMLGAIWLVVVRTANTPEHEIYLLATLVPVSFAFALGRITLGAGAAVATLVYMAVDSATYRHTVGEPLAVSIIFLAGTAVASIGAVLRILEGKRAVAAEGSRDAAQANGRALVADLREAQAIAHIGNWELDVASGMGKWSPEMYNLFGRDPATFSPTYTTSFESIHPDDRAAVDAEFQACIEQRRAFDMDHRIVQADGSVRFVNERARFEYGPDGQPLRASGTTQDITDRKQAEDARLEVIRKEAEVGRLQELARMRMEFLNAAAHDLKTPLTPLRLQMATLRTWGGLDGERLKGVALMERNVTRLQTLVDDMLDAARLQSGRLHLRRQDVALGPLVEEATLAFQEPARQRDLSLHLEPPPPVQVDADPAKSMQVLMNLVSNAVKYTPPGGQVKVRVDDRGHDALVAVQDNGLGLTPEQLDCLFQPFVRLHEDQAGVAKGTGLGLYISKGIMEEHGGRVWAESAGLGRGATFMASWPRAGVNRTG